jgi:hypothetical protein
MKRFFIVACSASLASTALWAHGGHVGGAAKLDEQTMVQEAQVAAMVNLVGPPGQTDPQSLGQKSIWGIGLRWPLGKALTVCMQHQSQPLRVLIAQVASEWMQNKPNLSLDFGDMKNPRQCSSPNASSDIRVADDPKSPLSPYWSWVGIQALSHKGEWTMDLGVDNGSEWTAAEALAQAAAGNKTFRNYFHFVVLHEFGHALGALHEHQWGTCAKYLIPDRAVAEVFPSATTPELKQQALSNLEALTKSQVDAWGAVRLSAAEDPLSVMRYFFPADIYGPGAPPFCANADIHYASAVDLAAMRKSYPQPGDPPLVPAAAAAVPRQLAADPNNQLTPAARERAGAVADHIASSASASPASPSGAAAAAAPGAPMKPLPPGAIKVFNDLVAAPSPR